MDPGSGGRSAIALAPDRESAAVVFGPVLDGALITTYDRAPAELLRARTLALLAAPGTSEVLRRLDLAEEWPDRVLLGVPLGPDAGTTILDLLADHPDVAPTEVTAAPEGLLVRLAPAGSAPPDAVRRAREALLGVVDPAAAASTPGADAAADGPAPSPDARGRRWRVPGARAALGATLLGIVLVAAVLAAWAAGPGALAALAAAVAVLCAFGCGLALGALFMVRQVRDEAAATGRRHRVVVRRMNTLLQKSRNAARNQRALARDLQAHRHETAHRLDQIQRQIEALGRLASRAQAESRDRPD